MKSLIDKQIVLGSKSPRRSQLLTEAGFNFEVRIQDIDEDYQYALVAGSSLKYLWILSRTTNIPESIRQRFIQKAKKIGYNTDELIWVKHN